MLVSVHFSFMSNKIPLRSVSSFNAYLCVFRINKLDAPKPYLALFCFPPSS